jgi:hypothetical protein
MSLEEKFKKWNLSINLNTHEDIIDQFLKLKIDKYSKIDIFFAINIFPQFDYVIQNNLKEIYYSEQEQQLIAKIFFDKSYGGRIGYTHGGGSFFILYLCSLVFCKLHFNEKYMINAISTSYLRVLPVPSYNIIKISYKDDTVIGEIINHEEKICVKLVSKIKNNIKF